MDEKELIGKSQHGDDEAFNMLIHLYREKIFTHCLGIVKDHSIADDLTQQTFLQAYRHLNSFHMKSSFFTWTWKIAHNLSLNYLKQQKQPLSIIEEQVAAPQFERETCREILHHLSNKHRTIFEMYYFEGLSQKEIAQKLHIPHGTVRSRLHYAKRRLRNFLK